MVLFYYLYMKSLSESLFDDNIKKNIELGDCWKLVSNQSSLNDIYGDVTILLSLFNESSLKQFSDDPYDVSSHNFVKRYARVYPPHKEGLVEIINMIMKCPLETFMKGDFSRYIYQFTNPLIKNTLIKNGDFDVKTKITKVNNKDINNMLEIRIGDFKHINILKLTLVD